MVRSGEDCRGVRSECLQTYTETLRIHLIAILIGLILLSIIGIAIALPVAYYFMHNWLENYVYRTNITAMLLIGASLITILITFITVSYKAWQASILNPADSIKTE